MANGIRMVGPTPNGLGIVHVEWYGETPPPSAIRQALAHELDGLNAGQEAYEVAMACVEPALEAIDGTAEPTAEDS